MKTTHYTIKRKSAGERSWCTIVFVIHDRADAIAERDQLRDQNPVDEYECFRVDKDETLVK